MTKTILITGATDGIGLETARMLAAKGQRVLLHGRNAAKLEALRESLTSLAKVPVETFVADLSRMADAEGLAAAVIARSAPLDVLINNAGVYSTSSPVTPEGLDLRFVVNTVAPYLLTQRLLPLLGSAGRVVNLSSAAQASVDLKALEGGGALSDNAAYAQSKLAITMWSRALADTLGDEGPAVIAVNPGSLLASKMVKDAFGVEGADLRIGADILTRAALSEEFADASGKYYDNDAHRFASPHRDALDPEKCQAVVRVVEAVLARTKP
ncbi:MAG: SDR family NAD(P)-dependent oxidoreductase [Kiloniellaceae bacterium]